MAGNDRRVDEHVELHGEEVNFVAGFLGNGKRGAKFPALGNLEAWLEGDVLGGAALGIEQNLVPAEEVELLGGGGAGGEAGSGSGEEEVEVGLESGGTGRDLEMEREHFNEITAPGNFFASGAEVKAGEIGDGAVGRVLAGNPFGVVESEVAGLHGDNFSGVDDFL